MRISKCVIVVVIAGLTMPHAAAAQPPQAPLAADDSLSNTRQAGCLMKITADPDVLILNRETMQSLLYASSVGLKAAREVLGIDGLDSVWDLVDVQWLDSSPAGPPSSADALAETMRRAMAESYSQEMMAEMNRIYGEQYREQMGFATDEQKKADRGSRTERSPRMNRRSTRGTGRTAGPRIEPNGAQTVIVELSVQLPEDIRPAAREFMNALVENLRTSLQDAYARYAEDLSNRLAFLESRREDANAQFERIRTVPSPERKLIEAQLETVIDLSMVSPEMAFSEAIEVFRNSVDPPLNIVVLWRDLLDVAEIEPDQSIHMDGVTSVKVGTALKVLLQAVGGGFARLTYEIKEGVIVVGTVDTLLEMSQEPPIVEIDAGALAPRKRELAYEIQGLELQLAGMQARRQAIQEQIARTEVEVERKVAGDEVTQELEEILAMTVRALAQEEGQFASQHPALQRSEAIRELREQVARAKIELAMRREEIARSAGGARLEMFNNDLSQIAIDSAEKQAQLGVLRGQIEETQQELVRASTFDPKAARIRLAREMMNVLDRRVAEQRLRLASLQPPTVTLLGAD